MNLSTLLSLSLMLPVAVFSQVETVSTNGHPDVVCQQVVGLAGRERQEFLKNFLAITFDTAQPAAITNLFARARATTNAFGNLLGVLSAMQAKLASNAALVERLKIRRADKQPLLRELRDERLILETLKIRMLADQNIIARFVERYETPWCALAAIRTDIWGPQRAMNALREELTKEYDRVQGEFAVLDRPAGARAKEQESKTAEAK